MPFSVVVTADPAHIERSREARRFAAAHQLHFVSEPSEVSGSHVLTFDPDRLVLYRTADGHGKGHVVDFSAIDVRTGAGNLSRNQPLPKAIGGETRTVVDATAGLGHDAVLLACMGYEVKAVERSPILAAMFEDGLRRAREREAMDRAIGDRLHVITGDSIQVLASMTERPEAVYIDPMFPLKRKKSALSKKSIRLVREIVGDDPDAGQLVELALRIALRRVVVKRPDYADPLGGTPDLCFKGKLVRYDVYLIT